MDHRLGCARDRRPAEPGSLWVQPALAAGHHGFDQVLTVRKAREDDTCHMQQYEREREVCKDLVHLLL